MPKITKRIVDAATAKADRYIVWDGELKPAKLEDRSLAVLLAEYRCRDGSREDFIDQTQRRLFSNGYSFGRINVEEHLKAAEKREKSDADFAELVESFTGGLPSEFA